MPRGKNYVNQNKGMTLQSSSASAMKELCFYGSNCQRKDCIYRHDSAEQQPPQSTDPCMAFLAHCCSFNEITCRKRHPADEAEVQALIAKYAAIPCRFQSQCKTKGCLFIHTTIEGGATSASNTASGGRAATTKSSKFGPSKPHSKKNGYTNNHTNNMSLLLQEPDAFPPLAPPPGAKKASSAAPSAASPSTNSSFSTTTTQASSSNSSSSGTPSTTTTATRGIQNREAKPLVVWGPPRLSTPPTLQQEQQQAPLAAVPASTHLPPVLRGEKPTMTMPPSGPSMAWQPTSPPPTLHQNYAPNMMMYPPQPPQQQHQMTMNPYGGGMYEPNTHQQQQYLHAPYPHSKSHYSHHHWTPTAAAMSSTGSEETMMTDHNNNNTMVGNQESLNIHAKEFVPDGNH